jgi:hypothetical protein
MKPSTLPAMMIVERPQSSVLALLFVAVFAFAAGFFVGDWMAEPRFAEREESIRVYIQNAILETDRIREQVTAAIKRGCYSYIDPDRPASARWLPGEM